MNRQTYFLRLIPTNRYSNGHTYSVSISRILCDIFSEHLEVLTWQVGEKSMDSFTDKNLNCSCSNGTTPLWDDPCQKVVACAATLESPVLCPSWAFYWDLVTDVDSVQYCLHPFCVAVYRTLPHSYWNCVSSEILSFFSLFGGVSPIWFQVVSRV